MADKTATLKEVQKYLAKGATDKAISELTQLVQESPDGNIFNTIGDLYLKKGDQHSGIEFYQKAASYFRQEGFYQKAQALYKKVLNLNPNNASALYAFGELSEEKGLTTDAIKYYLATADLRSKEGKKDQILQVYQKILSLSPANIPLRTKVAEIFIKEGLKSDASREYLHIARVHEEMGDHAKAKEPYLKALDLFPRSKEAALGLCELHEKLGEFAEAAACVKEAVLLFPDEPDVLLRCTKIALKLDDVLTATQSLHRIIEKEPENVQARKMLGDFCRREGSWEKAWEHYLPVLDDILSNQNHNDAISLLESFRQIDPVETGKRLISLYRQLGEQQRVCDELISLGDYYASHDRGEDAHACYEEILQIVPEHSLAKTRLASTSPEAEPMPAPDLPSATPKEVEIPDLDISLEEPEDFVGKKTSEEMPTESVGVQEPEKEKEPEHMPEQGEKSVDEIITEVDIFTRYGLIHEAQKLLEGLKNRFPDNIDVHLRLKTLYRDMDEKELAVTECIVLSGILKRQGDEEGSLQMLKEAYEINPEDPRMAEHSFGEIGKLAAFITPADEGFTQVVREREPDIEDYEEELAEAEFYFRQGLSAEAVTILEKLHKLFPENRDILERLHALGQTASLTETQEISSVEEFSNTLDLPDTSGQTGAVETPEPAKTAEVFSDTGEEPDQEGSPALPVSDSAFGGRGEELPAPAQDPRGFDKKTVPQEEETLHDATDAVGEAEYEDFSFSEDELVEAQEMPEPVLDNEVLEIFQEFKKGLEKELSDEDSETHYNLGIAYKEMGLIDDAIKEFQTSKNDSKRFLQSSTMLGVCYTEKGLYTLAIDVLDKAMKTVKEKGEAYWALRYELAEAYEKNNELKKALELYTEIFGWDAKFRNVSDKMGQLQAHMPRTAEAEKAQDKERPRGRKDRVSYL